MPQTLYIHPKTGAYGKYYEAYDKYYEYAADMYNAFPLDERPIGFDLFCEASYTTPLNDEAVLVDPRGSIVAVSISQGCSASAIDNSTGKAMAYWLYQQCNKEFINTVLPNLSQSTRILLPTSFENKRFCQLVADDFQPWGKVIVW